MARVMWEDETEAFRAKITTLELLSGREWPTEGVVYAGPFSSKRQATAAITRAKREAARWLDIYLTRYPNPHVIDSMVLGEVQSTGLTWTPVG